ncbi:unnamed protein product [Cochlearia groenlandica]
MAEKTNLSAPTCDEEEEYNLRASAASSYGSEDLKESHSKKRANDCSEILPCDAKKPFSRKEADDISLLVKGNNIEEVELEENKQLIVSFKKELEENKQVLLSLKKEQEEDEKLSRDSEETLLGQTFEGSSSLVQALVCLGVDEQELKRKWDKASLEIRKSINHKCKLLKAKEMDKLLRKNDIMQSICSMLVKAEEEEEEEDKASI